MRVSILFRDPPKNNNHLGDHGVVIEYNEINNDANIRFVDETTEWFDGAHIAEISPIPSEEDLETDLANRRKVQIELKNLVQLMRNPEDYTDSEEKSKVIC